MPDIVWIKIHGGRVKLESIDHVFEVKPFYIAKYAVTSAQFQAFVSAGDGYRNEDWWSGIEKSEAAAEEVSQETNVPREQVSWYEAVAFCRWLSHKARVLIRLPAEWEWQQAATSGDPTRDYPWPGQWDASRCNSNQSDLGRTTAVGMYPTGATTEGLLDMAGNLWEWCLNKSADPITPKSLSVDESFQRRVIRGGSYHNGLQYLRVSFRDGYSPDNRFSSVGFRLAKDV